MRACRGDNKPSGGGGSSIGEIFSRRVTTMLNLKMFKSYLGKRHSRQGHSRYKDSKGLDGAMCRAQRVIP